MNIVLLLITVVGGVTGLLSSVYLTVSLIVMIFYKVYRKARYHVSLYD